MMWWLVPLLSTSLALSTEELAYIQDQGLGLSAFDNGDGSVTLSTDGTPAHVTGTFPNQNNPNFIQAARMFYKVFAAPMLRAEGQEMMCLPKGPIGIAISGGYLFNPYDLSVEGCPWASGTDTDKCGGKPDQMGRYHYQQYSQCWGSPVCGVQSPLVGVALDGVAIYGPIDERGIQLTRHDLDKCGGRTDSLSGQYKYHVTADPPFVLGCFKAELRNDVGLPEAEFVCTCPYDDTTSVKEPVCDFSGEGYAPAICTDKMDETYDIKRKWEQSTPRQRLELFSCCPSGEECAPSCEEPSSNSNLSTCLKEQRGVTVLMNLPKTKSCWRTCYDECIDTEHCNCKRKCKRECTGKDNGSSDYRVKRGALKQECVDKNKVRSIKNLARRARNLAKRNRRKLLRS